MGRHINWVEMQHALTHGHIATEEDKARIVQEDRNRAAASAARRAQREARNAERLRAQPERDRLAAERRQVTAEREALNRQLRSMPIGSRFLMTRYKLTSQIGSIMQRLRILDGLYFTCSMEPGRGVWAERIAPPHGAVASGTDDNADLL